MYFRKKTSAGRAYLQIAHSQRVGGQVRQRVIATLGRLDVLASSGQLERLVRSVFFFFFFNGRSLARGLPDRWRRGAGAPSSLSSDGVARRGIAGAGAGRPHAVRPALHQGPGRGAAVCPPARSLQSLDLVFMDTTSLYFEGASGRPSAATATARTIARTSLR